MNFASPASNISQSVINNSGTEKKEKPRKRAPFSPFEDRQLKELVKMYGIEQPYVWDLISLHMKGRSARQCRERYKLYLDEGIKRKEKWTEEEDEILLSKYKLLGPRWKSMEIFFTGRTSYCIKNRYSSLKRKELKKLKYSKDDYNDESSTYMAINDDYGDNFENIFLFGSSYSDNFFDTFQ